MDNPIFETRFYVWWYDERSENDFSQNEVHTTTLLEAIKLAEQDARGRYWQITRERWTKQIGKSECLSCQVVREQQVKSMF